MTIVVINKTTTASGLTMNLANGTWGNLAHVWRLTSSNVIQQRADVSVTDGQMKTTLPAQSISLFAVAKDGGQPGNTAPHIDGPADAQANPAVTGHAVAFSVAASDADGDELSYRWSFGDGTQAFGASAAHVYETAGMYHATVTVSDGRGGFTYSTVNVTINAGNTLIVDTDGDSVSDASELAAGTDPFDHASTPTVESLTLGHLKAIVRFNVVAKDTIAISGRISYLPAVFLPEGQALTLNLNGSTHTYQLDKRGLAHLKGGSGQLILRRVRDPVTHHSVFPGGDAPFRLVVRGVKLGDVFGLTADTDGGDVGVRVEVILNGVVYAADPTPLYTPHGGRSGVVFQ
jgi:PKD repeat protein